MRPLNKIHHFSATVADLDQTLHFYRDILGLRLVKQTVNFDDPDSYHLYFGNYDAEVGSIITFFSWKYETKGRVGSGQVGTMAFQIPLGSTRYWLSRLEEFSITTQQTDLFGKPTVEFADPDGLTIALVENQKTSEIPAILSLYGGVLLSADPQATVQLLTEGLGMTLVRNSAFGYHLIFGEEEEQQLIVPKETLTPGRFGPGTVHHVAFLVEDDSLPDWKSRLQEDKYVVTKIKDRKYFQSIYLQEHGNVWLELATGTPGFTVDEPLETLGEEFMLPDKFLAQKSAILKRLPKLNTL